MNDDINDELIYNNSDNCMVIDRSKYCFKIDSFIDFEKDVCIDKRNNVLTRIDDDNNNKSIDIDNHCNKDFIDEKEKINDNVDLKKLDIRFELPIENMNEKTEVHDDVHSFSPIRDIHSIIYQDLKENNVDKEKNIINLNNNGTIELLDDNK